VNWWVLKEVKSGGNVVGLYSIEGVSRNSWGGGIQHWAKVVGGTEFVGIENLSGRNTVVQKQTRTTFIIKRAKPLIAHYKKHRLDETHDRFCWL